MRGHSIRPEDIVIGERHRALTEDAVSRLATSMAEIGLNQPITVRIVEEMVVDGDLTFGVPILVAGHHRLAAAKRLGWSHIDCIEVDDDILKAELWEIAENLHRCELTKEQRDHHIRRYAEVLEALRAEIQPRQIDAPEIGYGKPPPQEKGVARQVAEETGLSIRTVQRALNPAPRPQQALKPVIEPEPEHDAIIREANKIIAAWNAGRPAARELAMEQMDGAIFDNTSMGRAA